MAWLAKLFAEWPCLRKASRSTRVVLRVARALVPASDLRTLGLFRIFLGSLSLIELWRSFLLREELLGDTGFVPRLAYIQDDAWRQTFSLYFAAGTDRAILVMLALHACIGVCVTLGIHSQLASVLLLFFDLSLQTRTSCFQNVSGICRLWTQFWSIFAPIGARYAVCPEHRGVPLWVAHMLFAVQLACIYYTAAVTKTGQAWQSGTAVWHVMQLRYAHGAVARTLSFWPQLCSFLTHGSMYLETYGWIILFFPDCIRPLGLAAFCSFHIGIWATMMTGQLQPVMLTCLLALVPQALCDQIAVVFAKLFRCGRKMGVKNANSHMLQSGHELSLVSRVLTWFICVFLTGVGLAFSYSVVSINCLFLQSLGAQNAVCPRIHKFEVPKELHNFIRVVGMDQRFQMFPNPSYDWWVEIPGIAVNGTVFNLWDGGHPSLHKPTPWWNPDGTNPLRNQTMLTGDHRWVKFGESLAGQQSICNKHGFPQLARYVCDRWRKYHPVPLRGFAILWVTRGIDSKLRLINETNSGVLRRVACANEDTKFFQEPKFW